MSSKSEESSFRRWFGFGKKAKSQEREQELDQTPEDQSLEQEQSEGLARHVHGQHLQNASRCSAIETGSIYHVRP